MSKKLITAVQNSFKTHFKTKPLLVFAPGRINLIGEHTDYNEGFVFPGAINKGIVLAISKSSNDQSQVYALNKEELQTLSLDTPTPIIDGGWQNYILGVVAEIKKLGHHLDNFQAVFGGNIPEGAGLSSSAALENSFAFALNKLFGLGLSKKELILISQKAEHNFAGVQCGIMDQYASMFGVKKSAILLDCRSLESQKFKIDFENYQLMLINTNVKHTLSESAYNDRRSVCERVAKLLKIKALRDASLQDLETIKDQIKEEEYQKACYVIEENIRTHVFSEAIIKNDLTTLGQLLYQSHDGLRTKYKVSCAELDFLVDKAKETPHILGARMMGGGFGGCTLNLILKSEFKKFRKEIARSYKKEFGIDCAVYKVKLSKGTHTI